MVAVDVVESWRSGLEDLFACFAGRFSRVEPRRYAFAYVRGLLAPLERKTTPFDYQLPRDRTRGAHWVTPSLVGEVTFAEWTSDGRLRHPSWRGLRPDKEPADVHREL